VHDGATIGAPARRIEGGAMTDTTDPRPRASHPIVTAVRLRTEVRRYAMRRMDALGHAPLMDPALHIGVRTIEPGLDPVRVLVFGGGLAVGYGVSTRGEALDGSLARRLSRATGRGAVIENRAVRHVGVHRAAQSIGPAGTRDFQVAVWCPSFAESVERLSLSSWRSELHAMIRRLRQEERIPLVLTQFPEPTGLHPVALVARPWIHRINRLIAAVADECEGVSTVGTEPFVPDDAGAFTAGPAYFARVAERVAPAVAVAVLERSPAR
jgi:hypothetical protein